MNKVSALSTTVCLASTLLVLSGCAKHAKPHNQNQPQPLLSGGALQVGGEDVVLLNRTPTESTTTPQFVSATVFPGRGFNLFQITANIPGHGVVHLLASPTIEQAASALVGGPADQDGVASFSFGGAFLVPYPNRIVGKLVNHGQDVETSWQGHTLTLPADFAGKQPGAQRHSIHGLILADKVDNVVKTTTPDGETVTGILHAGNFGGHWLSKTDLRFSIALTGSAVTATITAKNVGDVAEPMGIGWHPYFALPGGNRAQALLHVPAAKVAVVNNYDDVFPTGQLKPVAGTPYDFNAPAGKPLGQMFLDDNFSSLTRTHGAMEVTLADPAAGYGLKVLGLSPQIRTIQVYAPPTKSFVAIEPQFNFADPFGKQWHGMDTGMVTLAPGQSVTWQTRLELFTPPPPPNSAAQAMPHQ